MAEVKYPNNFNKGPNWDGKMGSEIFINCMLAIIYVHQITLDRRLLHLRIHTSDLNDETIEIDCGLMTHIRACIAIN